MQSALQNSGIDLEVSLYRMYVEGRSAGFELMEKSTGEILFSMDIDVNRPIPPTKIYEVEGLRFRGVSPSQILADKISAISTDKVFRRAKDVVDLYYLSKFFVFDREEIFEVLKNSGRALNNFHGFLYKAEDLNHAYDKFRFAGDVNKPPFEELYHTVKSYLRDVLPKEIKKDSI